MKEPSFQKLRKQIEQHLKSITPSSIVPFDLCCDDKLPLNYTLNINTFSDNFTLKILAEEIDLIKKIDSRHLFYPLNKLHITLLGQIDINFDRNKLIKILEKILPKYQFKFRILGFGSNMNASSFTAYPKNFSIFQLRQEIREKLGVKTDNYTKFTSAYEYVGWINYLRYTTKPKKELLRYFYSKVNSDFGVLKSKQVQLLENTSRLLSEGKYKIIHEFNLL